MAPHETFTQERVGTGVRLADMQKPKYGHLDSTK